MKKLVTSFLISFAVFISPHGYGQEIDASMIQNLSSDQIAMAQEALKSNDLTTLTEQDASNKEESLKKNEEDEKSILNTSKFGYNFISTSPTSIIATGDLPLPNEYQISLGDVIGVVLSGSKEQIFDMKVQLDGTVFFPELGSISVVGESFLDIKNKFRNLIEQSYIGVSIDLSLKDLSAKKITIVGAVNNPGTYLVNPFTTISNSLAYSGGIQSIGSLRNIRLLRSNGDSFVFDLYKLLIDGDRTNDITIESGDVIVIGAASKFINITGMVKRPGTYEIIPGEDLSDILKFALGFSGGANTNKITIDKLDLESSSIIKIITNNTAYSLKDVLSVNVFSYQNDNTSNILVSGAVEEPGYYKLEDYVNLEELITDLNFVDVYPWLAVLEQFDEDSMVKSTILFNLNDPNTFRSIKLLPNSRLFFANIDSREYGGVSDMATGLIADYDLRINHKQGTYTLPVFGRFDVKSFINLLGLDMSDVEDEATYISPLDNIIIKDDYKNMQFIAKKYNTISFRSPVNDLIRVSIGGAVDFPGTYTMNSNSVINDLYELVGDLKPEAFLEGIIFTRQSVRNRQMQSMQKSREELNKALLISTQKGESIGDISVIRALSQTIEPENLGRIAGDFSPESLSARKTILLDGDSIIVPRNPNTINVLGEVLNPIAFEYNKGITVRSAIDYSGGYQDYANKRKVYVIKANGLIERASRNIFTKNVKLEPGDTIVVPRKIVTNNPGIDALIPITNILSDLAFSAAALETLSNNN
ncbi:SLBB domain-containing protein [Gammaproteobacteria bacterium]|nr:SLBB domain-containing protein [Gammaproteobacteria bacterium]